MKSYILIFSLLFSAQLLVSQNKVFEKAKKAYSTNNFKGANKLIDQCTEHPETKNKSEVSLLKSKIAWELHKDINTREKYPKAFKDAMKFAEKAIEQSGNLDQQQNFRQEHYDFLIQLLKFNNKEALEAYNTKRYSKALPMFKNSMALGIDTQSLVLVGDCYYEMGQRIESLPYFKKAAEMIYNAVLDSNTKVLGYFKIPFRKLGHYYFDLKSYDTAYVFVKKGRDVVPNDQHLSDLTYGLMKYNLNKILPSEDYLLAVENGLNDFPSDSFLNHKQNSIYIFLLNGLAKSNEQHQFDSFLLKFAKAKKNKASLKTIELVKKYDIFAGLSPEAFYPRICNYFAEYQLKEAAYSTFVSKHYPRKASNPLVLEATERPRIAEIYFKRAIELLPKESKLLTQQRNAYTKTQNKLTQNYYDVFSMILLNEASAKDAPKDLEFKQKTKEFRLRLINDASDSGDFRLARTIFKDCKKAHPETAKQLELLWYKILENDFKQNYFGSKMSVKAKNDPKLPGFYWNGNVDSCRAGKMTMQEIVLLEKRINYFRRNAGVSEEIVLTKQDNIYAEIAAMMCEANKSLNHQPNDGWRCFIPAGADALKEALLIKESNPSIAITAAMGHHHPTVGNRRWLLYPKAQYMGFGNSKNYSIIKAIDQSRDLDTNKYKTQFVCWPPENGVSKMLVFKKWSFSLQADFTNAVVTMKDAKGNTIEVKQEANEPGYGLNTIVWEPVWNMNDYLNQEILISIKLKNNTVYTYKTKVLEFVL